MNVRPKKHLGQHFLKDKKIAEDIVNSLISKDIKTVVEVGPGMGVLTDFLLEKDYTTYVVELDSESVEYLHNNYPQLGDRILQADFLKMDFENIFKTQTIIIGNFPYNISSQILFKVLEHKELIPEVVGMFQKEVAERIASKPGNKVYGILSVLMQAYYNVEYLFTVEPEVFNPPPKVRSGVIRFTRKDTIQLDCNEKLFKTIIKAGFNQRRKTLRNSLKGLLGEAKIENDIMNKRPEQLSWQEFVVLTNMLESEINK